MLHKATVSLGLALLSGYALAQDCKQLDYRPYFGVGVKMNHQQWEKGFGHNVFRKDLPQGEFFVGAQVHENLGFDIGYQATPTKRKFVTLGANESFLGLNTSVISDPPVSYLSFVQTKGVYAAINGMLPLTSEKNLSLLGQIGITHLNVIHITHTIADTNPPPSNILTTKLIFNAKKLIPKLAIGLQYQPSQQNFGIRGTVNWDNTKRFGKMYVKNLNRTSASVKMKNTFNYGLSIYYQFL